MRKLLICLCLLATATVALAQNPAGPQDKAKPVASQEKSATTAPENPFSTYNKHMYEGLKGILLRSADKVPEQDYSFKPTDAVRSYGQILGHVADAQYLFCSTALGEKNPAPHIEKTKTSKADLIVALKEAFAYCDKAYDGMTDASGAQMVKLFGGDTPKLDVLTVNIAHDAEHYGNLVTYMRLKNIVPPTSEQPSQPQPKTPEPKK